MKRALIIFLIVFAVPCAAQWKTASAPALILTFGVHDTSFFLSTPGDGNGPSVQIFVPGGAPLPYYWDEAYDGISFGDGNVTWFASLGRYFYANEGQQRNTNTYISSDNGSQWLESPSAVCIGSNGHYLFGTTTRPFTPEPPYIALSRDSGNTWDSVGTFNNGSWQTSFSSIGICIFANTGSGIMRSRDTGNTWAKISPTFLGPMTTMGSLLFITGGGNVIESTDSGTDWNPVPVDSGGTVPEYVNVLATDGKNLFAGTSNGVYLSKDIGKTWLVENTGLIYLNIGALGVFDTLLFANASGTGGYYTTMRSIREMTKDTTSSVVQTQPMQENTLSIFPNPASRELQITSTHTGEAHLFDVLGRERMQVAIGGISATVDVSHLEAGMYFLRLGNESAKVEIAR